MRGLILALSDGLILAASAEAAPLALNHVFTEFGARPSIELVRNGCGRGWHRDRWRDQTGYAHWGHCIPNGDPQDAWTAGWSHPYQDGRPLPPQQK